VPAREEGEADERPAARERVCVRQRRQAEVLQALGDAGGLCRLVAAGEAAKKREGEQLVAPRTASCFPPTASCTLRALRSTSMK